MLYYCEYSNGRRYVRTYDKEKHGAPRIVGKSAFLYRGSVSVSAENIFSTEVVPAQHFGNDTPGSVFIPWDMVRGELWPGEY